MQVSGAVQSFDVTILGGGLAGLCLARQLRREAPQLRVVVVEKTTRPLPDATHKVGESSVELGSRYLEDTLGLGGYLRERHLIKNGLRFFPGGGAEHALADRMEIGPPQLPRVPSFQIDRGRFENDLRGMCVDDGVTLLEGVKVQRIQLGEPHLITLNTEACLESRWVVDASGRRRMLARQLGLQEDNEHVAHAAWFRIDGRLDIDHLVDAGDQVWHARDPDHIRWLSTSHLMGRGYWVWIIPLSTGATSIGLVAHGHVHPFEVMRTRERLESWIEGHEPALARALRAHQVTDFLCLKDFSYGAKQLFSKDRWALVGEAGLFVDPFYSPGSDFIAVANAFAGELIKADTSGRSIAEQADYFNFFYRRLARISTATYAGAADAYGQPRVMAAKIYWDNANYWSFVCQYFFQELYRLPLDEQKALLPVCEAFASLNLRAQKMFTWWAAHAHDVIEREHVIMPPIPSVLANLHLDLERKMDRDEAHAYLREKADQAERLLTDLLLRAASELGATSAERMVEEIGARGWPLLGLEERISAERGGRRGRRKRLPRLSRDLERTLGAARGEWLSVAEALFPAA